jgi:cysteine desulfurase/selenocysteine lyase
MAPETEHRAIDRSDPAQPRPWDLDAIRDDFPILGEQVRGVPLAYLDNAATSQKPAAVIDAIADFYRHDNANVHRAVHTLAERATAVYEMARERVRGWINAASADEIVFLRGTTEAINLIANALGQGWSAGDRVVLTTMEHHANIVPWQLLRERSRIEIAVLPITPDGDLDLDALPALLDPPTRLLALTHVSNVLGTVNPIAEVVRIAHDRGVPVLVDGAQAMAHQRVDVQALGCDFYAFSGHKMFGPTGIGVLYGEAKHLAALPPWQGGGEMIRRVTFERTRFAPPPERFEAGTQDFAGAVGLAAAIGYLGGLDHAALVRHEAELLRHARERLEAIPGLRIIGRARHKAPVLSFLVDGVHAHDLGTLLDRKGVAVRTGHHCAMPLMDFYGVPATSRASLAFYNTLDEVDRLADAIDDARKVLA